MSNLTSFSPNDILSMAFLRIYSFYPYLQQIAYGLIRKEEPGLGTVAVSAKGVLYWDAQYIGKLTVKQAASVLVHEILHVLYDHNNRRDILFADPRIWNFAGDVCINANIRAMGNELELPSNCLSEKSFNPPLPENKTAEEYYWILKERSQFSCLNCGENIEGKSDHECPKEGQQGVGNGQCGSGAGHKHPKEKDLDGVKGRSAADFDLYRKMVAEAIRKHAASKGRGTIPDGMLRWADIVLAPAKIPWQQKLRRSVRNSIMYIKGKTDYTYNQMSRLQHSIGFGKNKPILPAMQTCVVRVGVALDTSGSMSQKEIEIGLREINGILKSQGIKPIFFACDAAVHAVQEVRTIPDVLKLLKGGGGTDFDPVFEHINKMNLKTKPNLLVYVTDGICSPPSIKVRDLKTIWLLVGKSRQNPGFDPNDIVIECED